MILCWITQFCIYFPRENFVSFEDWKLQCRLKRDFFDSGRRAWKKVLTGFTLCNISPTPKISTVVENIFRLRFSFFFGSRSVAKSTFQHNLKLVIWNSLISNWRAGLFWNLTWKCKILIIKHIYNHQINYYIFEVETSVDKAFYDFFFLSKCFLNVQTK